MLVGLMSKYTFYSNSSVPLLSKPACKTYLSYFKNLPYFSVDTKKDLAKVSRYMKKDKIFKKIFKK